MTDYNKMETEKLQALYKKSCAEFRTLTNDITAMRLVLTARQQVAEARAKLAAAEAQLKAANAGEVK